MSGLFYTPSGRLFHPAVISRRCLAARGGVHDSKHSHVTLMTRSVTRVDTLWTRARVGELQLTRRTVKVVVPGTFLGAQVNSYLHASSYHTVQTLPIIDITTWFHVIRLYSIRLLA